MKVYFSKNTYNLFIEGNLNALELPLAVPVLITVEYPGVVDGVEDDLFLKSKQMPSLHVWYVPSKINKSTNQKLHITIV